MNAAARRRSPIAALCTVLSLVSAPTGSVRSQTILRDKETTAPAPNPAQDPNRTVITDIDAWHHPTKAVFEKYKIKLIKVDLTQNKKYPTFHVADFHADPTSGMTTAFFNKFNLELLQANGFNDYTVLEENYHDGFKISYDKQKHRIMSDLLVGEDR